MYLALDLQLVQKTRQKWRKDEGYLFTYTELKPINQYVKCYEFIYELWVSYVFI